MKKYKEFILEKLNTNRDYKKILNLIDIDFKYKLNLNIDYYFKIYKTLFDNTNLHLNKYQLFLLIISSFLRLSNGKNSDIEILKDEIKINNIYDVYNSSFKILNNIYKLLLIINKSLKNTDILFNNIFILSILFDYLNNKKINIYEFNSMFDNELNKDIIDFINKN